MTTTAFSQDKKVIELEPSFSTTRLVTREKPVITNDTSSKVQSKLNGFYFGSPISCFESKLHIRFFLLPPASCLISTSNLNYEQLIDSKRVIAIGSCRLSPV
jgi:hypothetical protein